MIKLSQLLLEDRLETMKDRLKLSDDDVRKVSNVKGYILTK